MKRILACIFAVSVISTAAFSKNWFSQRFFEVKVGTDIDFSNHTNNAVYIRHILNTFPSDFFGKHTVEDFEIHYLHETLEGDLLSIYKKQTDNTFEFLIKSGDNEVVRAKLAFN